MATYSICHAAAIGEPPRNVAHELFLHDSHIVNTEIKTCTPHLSKVFDGSACARRCCAGQVTCKAPASDCLLMRTPDKGPDRAGHARHSDNLCERHTRVRREHEPSATSTFLSGPLRGRRGAVPSHAHSASLCISRAAQDAV